MRRRWFRTVCAAACLAVLVGTTGWFTGLREAAAAVTRVAVVKSLKGTVQVKKAGGSQRSRPPSERVRNMSCTSIRGSKRTLTGICRRKTRARSLTRPIRRRSC